MNVDIRGALKANNITIEDIARRLGVNRQTIYFYIKQGDKNPLSQLERIASAIGIDVIELFEKKSDFVAMVSTGAEILRFDSPDSLAAYIKPMCGAELEVKVKK